MTPTPRLVPDRPSDDEGRCMCGCTENCAVVDEQVRRQKAVIDRIIREDNELYSREIDAAAPPAEAPAERGDVDCFVRTMRTSKGPEFFVVVKHGDRELTPHMYAERWKAEYDVAAWQHLLNGAPEPDLLAYGPDDDAAPAAPTQGRPTFECDGDRFIPVSTKALAFLRDTATLKAALGKLSPYMLTQGGFTPAESDAVMYLYGIAESFDYDVAAPRVTGGRDDSKDAARYRWLRDGENGGHVSAGIVESERPQGAVGDNGWERVEWLYDDELDAAIDAALQAATGVEG